MSKNTTSITRIKQNNSPAVSTISATYFPMVVANGVEVVDEAFINPGVNNLNNR
jgi:hypothetical protein